MKFARVRPLGIGWPSHGAPWNFKLKDDDSGTETEEIHAKSISNMAQYRSDELAGSYGPV